MAFDPFRPTRRKTRVVRIGDVTVGGDEPIRVQSMTTSFTWDVPATLAQMERLAAAGCEIVRVTVPTLKDAQALPELKAGMRARGITMPLVADIHFSPKLAQLAVEHVEKVRVNPGNFTDKKRFEQRSYTDAEYAEELERIEKAFTPLVLRARERGVAMRIGTNHGSLSDRIVNRYGDSPEGMVESALEFVRICRQHDYHELVLSMKASNTRIMLEAYRLLAARMEEEGMDYPFHLGVTEAGDGDDARIKSAIGIGTLLQDGIGDTIRVSLTEDPALEVPVGFALGRRAGPQLAAPQAGEPLPRAGFDPAVFARRAARRTAQGPRSATALGADQDVRVEAGLGRAASRPAQQLADQLAALTGEDAGERRLEVAVLDLVDASDTAAAVALRAALEARPEVRLTLAGRLAGPVWRDPAQLSAALGALDRLAPVGLQPGDLPALAGAFARHPERCLLLEVDPAGRTLAGTAAAACELVAAARAAGLPDLAVGLSCPPGEVGLIHPAAARVLAAALDERGLNVPLVLWVSAGRDGDGGICDAACGAGGLLVDGIGDALRVDAPSVARGIQLAYGILQGARRRTTQTEYISCPGCGRTLFELEPVTARIKALTSHLKGVKIAVMGCVVNGPGEMADADFGYVGWKPGKVNLYVGKECVVREVPEDDAPERLVELIKEHGRWSEPAPVRQALPLAT